MRIGHFPQKMGVNLEHNCRSIAKINPTFGALSEQDWGAGTYLPRVRKTIGGRFRILTQDKGGHSQETPILFRRSASPRWRITDVRVTKVSDDLGKGIGNDRWQIEVKAETRRGTGRKRRVGLIWTHWNAVIQDRATGRVLNNARWKAMDEKAGPILEYAIAEMKSDGRTVFVGGDFNYRVKGDSEEWEWAPENIFRRAKMRFVVNGLDYLAWTRDVEPGKAGVRVVMHDMHNRKAVNRSDHPWLYGNFRWVRK